MQGMQPRQSYPANRINGAIRRITPRIGCSSFAEPQSKKHMKQRAIEMTCGESIEKKQTLIGQFSPSAYMPFTVSQSPRQARFFNGKLSDDSVDEFSSSCGWRIMAEFRRSVVASLLPRSCRPGSMLFRDRAPVAAAGLESSNGGDTEQLSRRAAWGNTCC